MTPALWVLDADGCGLAGLGRRADHYLQVLHQSLASELGADDVLVVHDSGDAASHWLEQPAPPLAVRTLLWEATRSWEQPLVDLAFARKQERPKHVLPAEELSAALTASNRRDLCIGGSVLRERGLLILVRGDLDSLVVPLASLGRTTGGVELDLSAFSVTDYGQTLQFGSYELALDALLYEHDAEYRRRVRAQLRAEDRSLGASIRRLRLQKGLRQEDFGEVPARTLARIENGEVARPRRATLELIARRLGVEVEGVLGW